jgi:bacterioferritin-associated ferredoxin
MIICSCNVIKESDILAVLSPEIDSAEALYACLGCTIKCGKCTAYVEQELISNCPRRQQ